MARRMWVLAWAELAQNSKELVSGQFSVQTSRLLGGSTDFKYSMIMQPWLDALTDVRGSASVAVIVCHVTIRGSNVAPLFSVGFGGI